MLWHVFLYATFLFIFLLLFKCLLFFIYLLLFYYYFSLVNMFTKNFFWGGGWNGLLRFQFISMERYFLGGGGGGGYTCQLRVTLVAFIRVPLYIGLPNWASSRFGDPASYPGEFFFFAACQIWRRRLPKTADMMKNGNSNALPESPFQLKLQFYTNGMVLNFSFGMGPPKFGPGKSLSPPHLKEPRLEKKKNPKNKQSLTQTAFFPSHSHCFGPSEKIPDCAPLDVSAYSALWNALILFFFFFKECTLQVYIDHFTLWIIILVLELFCWLLECDCCDMVTFLIYFWGR